MKKFFSAIILICGILSSGCAQSSKKSIPAIEGKEGLFAVIATDKGDIVVELFYKQTPLTVTNFVGLAEGTLTAAKGKKFFDGLKFHRVEANFVIQGGDPEGTGYGGPGYRFENEPVKDLKFDVAGRLAMANSGPDTNGSQFFITHVPTEPLNYNYTIFGTVIEGQNVVNSIQKNDKIKSVRIYRNCAEAEAFTATQADFDKRIPLAKQVKKEFEKAIFNEAVAGCSESENGIYYQILKQGTGNKIGNGKKVKVEYRGYMINGRIFDASRQFHPQGHDPLEFITGSGGMIKGFDQMVADMKPGEIRKIVIPPELGYGSAGVPQIGIKGGDYICFDICVVN